MLTIGDDVGGGGIEMGSTINKLALFHGTEGNDAVIVSKNVDGYGRGNIEMRTRQLNIGFLPGVNNLDPFPLRIVQSNEFGIKLIGTQTGKNWEMVTNFQGDFDLYADDSHRGRFDRTSGNYSPTSDSRLKTNINSLVNILPSLLQLKPKKYNYKTNASRAYFGLLAQDIQKIFPDIVTDAASRDGQASTLLVDYNQLAILAIQAIQEQQVIITAQQKKIDDMESRLARLEEMMKE